MWCKHFDVHNRHFNDDIRDWYGLLYGRFDEKDCENICLALLSETYKMQGWRPLRLI